MEKGREEGREEGIKQGEKRNAFEFVISLYFVNLSGVLICPM
jgi:hypothetical protein